LYSGCPQCLLREVGEVADVVGLDIYLFKTS
jgi:hypothetical protein